MLKTFLARFFSTNFSQHQQQRTLCLSGRIMADHISITADKTRNDTISSAIVTEIQDLSQTVKLLKLHADDTFMFKAGQWVDMFIPGVKTIGGFSMCSAPDLLASVKTFHLAIKYSTHPPAYWIHTKCQVGDKVMVRSGGDFFYDPDSLTASSDVLLLAGGVGINPLYSILLHFLFLSSKSPNTSQRRANLLYSAKTMNELLFREELMDIDGKSSNINIQLHCSKDAEEIEKGVKAGQIDQTHVESALKTLDRSNTEVFICGPSPFISAMESFCQRCHIPPHRVHYEKWW